jgi:hypothetical protein
MCSSFFGGTCCHHYEDQLFTLVKEAAGFSETYIASHSRRQQPLIQLNLSSTLFSEVEKL